MGRDCDWDLDGTACDGLAQGVTGPGCSYTKVSTVRASGDDDDDFDDDDAPGATASGHSNVSRSHSAFRKHSSAAVRGSLGPAWAVIAEACEMGVSSEADSA
jgi:hypothetical protein